MTNLINLGHLRKAHNIKPLINLNNVMKKFHAPSDSEIINELPNTHQCFSCGKQVPLRDYRTRLGKRYCSLECEDLVAERNPVDYDADLMEEED